MSAATFTRRPARELGPGVVQFTRDCPHGTTHADVIPGTDGVPSAAWIRTYLVLRHEDAEGCGCARRLGAGSVS